MVKIKVTKLIEIHRYLSYYRGNSILGSIENFNLKAKVTYWPEAKDSSVLTLSNMFIDIILDETFNHLMFPYCFLHTKYKQQFTVSEDN